MEKMTKVGLIDGINAIEKSICSTSVAFAHDQHLVVQEPLLPSEIKQGARKCAVKMAKFAAEILHTDPAQYVSDYESRLLRKAYIAARNPAWDPSRCALSTWVFGALHFECLHIRSEIFAEAASAAHAVSLDTDAAHDVIEMAASATSNNFYEPIELRDIREQLHNPVHLELFDSIVRGASTWHDFAFSRRWSRHQFYDRILPGFRKAVAALLGVGEKKEVPHA